MKANRKEMFSGAPRAPGKSALPAWTPAKTAIHFLRRILPGILALGATAGLGLVTAGSVTAQTLGSFSFPATSTNASGVYTNSEGANPFAGFTLAGNSYTGYGTAAYGGTAGYGTVFAINADGTGFTVLHNFVYSDGANPWAGLVSSGNTLYGTAYYGGASGNGAVFAINTDGTGFRVLHSFAGSDGAYPNGGLIASGNTLYGTTAHGGISGDLASGYGTVFAINTDGTGFSTLHTFTPTVVQLFYDYDGFGQEYYVEMNINTDGAVPVTGLVLAGNTLYGTSSGGGYGGNGTVFGVNTDGTGFTTLHSFEQTENLTRHPIGSGGTGGGLGGGGCTGGGCGAGSQCVGGYCGCAGFCSGGG